MILPLDLLTFPSRGYFNNPNLRGDYMNITEQRIIEIIKRTLKQMGYSVR